MDEEEWFVTNGEWRMGPLAIDDLVEVLGREHAPGSLLVWKTGLETWTRPELVSELTTAAARPTRRVARPADGAGAGAGVVVGAGAGTPFGAGVGGAAPLAAPWFRVGTAKLLLMCVVTFGVYEIYWFYQQWRHVQRRGERVHPALRTLFAGLFCYALFRRVSQDATERGIARAPSAVLCAAAFIALAVTVRLPDPWSTLSLLQLLPLALVQRAASAAALAAVPGADPNTRLTPINWLGVAFGVMLLLLTALAATLPPPGLAKPAPAKTTPAVTTQAALVPDAGRPTQAAPTIR
jgi:hypothetical protein